MSWATTFWDLEYIVDSARRAMEAGYIAEDEAAFAAPIVEPSVVEDGEMMESCPASNSPVQPLDRPAGNPLEELAVSMKKQSLADKQPSQPASGAKLSSPWTSEIEAALRAFLRPFSMNVRYEYRFSDMLDERRSIETMNRFFKQPAKPDDGSGTRDISLRDEIRRKRAHELRRAGARNTGITKPDHTNR